MEELPSWKILRSYMWDYVRVNEPHFRRIPLRVGAVSEQDGFKVEIMAVRIVGETLVVEWEVLRKEDFERDHPSGQKMVVSYPNGYFGASTQFHHQEKTLRMPLLQKTFGEFRSAFLSPLSLPENELSGEELLQGAELWLTVGKVVEAPDVPDERPENFDGGLREKLASEEFGDEVKMRLNQRGREAMGDVLAAEPWSGESWEKVVMPYLVKFAEESDLSRLLELLELNPWMADLFLEKGWAEEAEPIVREHLEDGKTLTKRAVIYLAELGEEELGDDLVNQLLRMSGDFDAVAEAVKGHPGVVWDEVRQEAWRRMATGFGSHHVWMQWGAEMGEKEALRRFLVEAIRGKKWEREMLEEWFGKDEDVVEMLRKKWERVVFRDGKWLVNTEFGL